jgi:type 1 fimbria pilin
MTVGATPVEFQPFSTNTHTLNLTFSGTTANCGLTIVGATGTTRIDNVNITLRDNLGNTVAQWTNQSANGTRFIFSRTASPVVVGRTYTLSFTGTVHRNGVATPVSGSVSRVR